MDMQPLEPLPEVTSAERRRKNHQIISRGTRNFKAKPVPRLQVQPEDPPILMMSSVSEGDSIPSIKGQPPSPSRRLLLINEERAKHAHMTSTGSARNSGSRGKKHGKRASTSKVGMSSKIRGALFRERRSSSHGSFSKMEASDANSSHFFKRSARSPFYAVEPGSRSLDVDAVGELSFDNTSTNSGPVVLESPSRNRLKPIVRQEAPSPPTRITGTAAGVLLEPTATGNVSALSMSSMGSDYSSIAHNKSSFVRTMPAGSFPAHAPAPKDPSSIASSCSSLNYSESHGSSRPQSPYFANLNSGSPKAHHQHLKGIQLATTQSEDPTMAPRSEVQDPRPQEDQLNTRISDLVQQRLLERQPQEDPSNTRISDLVQQRLLERLEQDFHTPKTPSHQQQPKRIQPIRPPPSLPPKAPRNNAAPITITMENTSANSSFVSPNVNTSACSNAPLNSSAAYSCASSGAMVMSSMSLKQHEERLLRGGDFLNESMESHSAAGESDLALKLLHRLEAAQADAQLMTDHYDQDPPLAMSFSSSTITTKRTSSGASLSIARTSSAASFPRSASTGSFLRSSSAASLARKASNASSAYSAAIPYAAFMVSEGLEPPLAAESDHQRSRPSATSPVLEGEEKNDEEDDIILESNNKDAIEDQSVTELCYLYSQDKEFENSILSPSNQSHCPSHHSVAASVSSSLPLPATPKQMYRSDAIDAFLESAQSNLNSNCSKDHCVAVIEEAASQMLDSTGGVGGARSEDAAATASSPAPTSCTELEDGDSDTGIKESENDHKSIVSDEFLSMMTSGCTGAPNPAAKEAVKEKLVALEAGWSGFRSQVHEGIQSLEESWQGLNLNKMMPFHSPGKTKATEAEATATVTKEEAKPTNEGGTPAALTPTTMSTTVTTTPPTLSTVKMPDIDQQTGDTEAPKMTPKAMFPEDPVEGLELISQADDSIVGVMKSPLSMDAAAKEVVLGVVRELERNRIRSAPIIKNNANRFNRSTTDPSNERYTDLEDAIERIEIGTTERDVPMSLKHTLADISIIVESGNADNSGSSSYSPSKPRLDSSEDSEGGKVILDAAEWDPIDSSHTEMDDIEEEAAMESVQAVNEVPPSRRDPGISGTKPGGFVLFKRKRSRGKKHKAPSQSPKSVLGEF